MCRRRRRPRRSASRAASTSKFKERFKARAITKRLCSASMGLVSTTIHGAARAVLEQAEQRVRLEEPLQRRRRDEAVARGPGAEVPLEGPAEVPQRDVERRHAVLEVRERAAHRLHLADRVPAGARRRGGPPVAASRTVAHPIRAPGAAGPVSAAA